MQENLKNIKENSVEDKTFKKIPKDDLWRVRAGFRGDSFLRE